MEATIALTAFVVVAAVFSYMVLGACFFSTEKAKEVIIHMGVEKATSSAEVTGDVIGHGWLYITKGTNTSIVATIYPADKKDFRLNPYRVFGVNGAEPRY